MTGGRGRSPSSPAPVGPSTGTPVVDPAVVDSLRRLGERSGRDVLGELTELFSSTADAQILTAWEHLEAGDHAQLARVAHSLKGSSSVIGGRHVAAAAAELEELATGSPAGDPDREAATRAALTAVVAELERYRLAVEGLSRPS